MKTLIIIILVLQILVIMFFNGADEDNLSTNRKNNEGIRNEDE